MKRLRIGTRGSRLALWQTMHTKELLELAHPGLECDVVPFVTEGDKSQAKGKPLPEIGGKGLFTLELEDALRDGRIDIAVHSLKDLPTAEVEDLTLGAIFGRTEVRDLYVSNHYAFSALPQGSVVGTSSIRRKAQLLAKRPDLIVRPIRGNIDTRIRKMASGEYDAIILAAAGVDRLGVESKYMEPILLEWMLPAPAQGALGVQCRKDDAETRALLQNINDEVLTHEVTIERGFLAALESGCSAPVGAYAKKDLVNDEYHLDALVASPDGTEIIRIALSGTSDLLASRAATIARERGAAQILAAIHEARAALPLLNRRIMITRPKADAEDMALEIARLGGVGIVAPLIRINPIVPNDVFTHICKDIASFQWIVFTSTNAVRIFFDQYMGGTLPSGVKTAAVGPRTRRALEERGVIADAVPKDWDSAHVPDVMGDVLGVHILLPQGQSASLSLARTLETRGALVTTVPLYETEPIAFETPVLKEITVGVDAILFTSGSQVRSYLAQFVQLSDLKAILDKAIIGCIGPSTEKEFEGSLISVTLRGSTNSEEGLIESLVAHFSK